MDGLARYVEVFNFGPGMVDLEAEGWALQRYTNELTTPQPAVPLRGPAARFLPQRTRR